MFNLTLSINVQLHRNNSVGLLDCKTFKHTLHSHYSGNTIQSYHVRRL